MMKKNYRDLLKMLLIGTLCISWITQFAYARQNEFNPDGQSFALIELFTSEGCSSCPPADALLTQLDQEAQNQNKQLFVLSFSVDYWDYLGWKDPFSSPEFTQRQQQYSKALQSTSVYTPQMIVNGVYGFVGSDERKARAYIDQLLNLPSESSIKIKVQKMTPAHIEVHYQCKQWALDLVIHFALVKRQVQSQVTAGENTGRMLKHINIVREFKTINFKDKEGSISLENPSSDDLESYMIIAYVQDKKTMRIVAADSVLLK